MSKILISSCLLGLNVRYDGGNKKNKFLVKVAKEKNVVFICPEQLGGLPTPRPPIEIEPGKNAKDVLSGKAKVITKAGEDYTEQVLSGAYKTLEMCKQMGVTVAVLKVKSPSCGNGKVYNGSFKGELVPGNGIVAELLEQNGIKVYNEENYPKNLFC